MTKLGIIGAMDVEVETLLAEMEQVTSAKKAGSTFHEGVLMGLPVVLVQCGVGKVNAAVCAQTMALIYEPELIINSGVSGALSPELRVGDVVIGTDVVQHDVDTTALGDEPGFVSTVDRLSFPLDNFASTAIAAAAEELGIHAVRGRIASGDQFISSAERKDAIVKTFGAIACEMEGAAIGQVCYVNRVPFCVLRAISDSADGSSHMDYPTFVGMAAEQSVKLLRTFLKN